MHRRDRGRRQRLHREVAVRDRIERVRHRPVEAERLGGHVTIERKRRARKRGGAERTFVQPLARIGKAAAIARRHLDIGEQVMAERHRLRGLQMGEAGHDGVGMLERLLGERALISASAASIASIVSRIQSRKSVAT